jgi:hypothetical protein
MKEYTFQFELNSLKETAKVWDQWNMGDVELNVKYEFLNKTLHISSVILDEYYLSNNKPVELVHILRAMDALGPITYAAEHHYEFVKVGMMSRNYQNIHANSMASREERFEQKRVFGQP